MPETQHFPNPDAAAVCETCGAAISATAADGLCGACLFQSFGMDAAGSSAPAAEGEVLRFFGDYELLEEVARGGMGVVYRARQVSLGRTVAVKLLHSSGDGSKGFAARFKVEAAAAAGLDHPHIVPVFEFGEYAEQPFLAMRYVPDGRSLSGAKVGEREAVEIMVKTAQAMHYAHQRGVLHRDLKPANILLDESGEPLVSDFGLAKLMESDSHLTRSVEMMGTPAYMPPEQAAGKLSQVTTAADVYGLGAIFYELLTGRAPFRGESGLEIIRKVTDEPPARLTSIVKSVDRDLETICLKCLEKEPAKRYASALALADDLQRWLRNEPIRARPAGTVERLWKWARRHPAIASVSAIALLAVTVIAVGATVFSLRLQKSAEENRQQIIGLHQLSAEQMVDDGESFTGLLHLAEAIRLEERDTPGSAHALRSFYQSIVRQSPAPAQMWFHAGKAKDAVFSPDGSKVLAGCDDGVAFVYDAASGALLHRLEHGWRIERVHWNSTGTRLALWSDKAWASLWDAATGAQIGSTMWAYPLIAFHPDGTRLLAPTPLKVEERDAADGRLLRVLHDQHVADAAYLPDGSRLILAERADDEKSVLYLLDAQSGAVLETSCREARELDSLQISGDGTTIAARASFKWAYLWKTADFTAPPLRWDGGASNIASLSLDASGQQLAAGSTGGSVALVECETAASLHSLALGRPAARVAFRRDGRQLATASAGGQLRLWDLPARQPSAPALWQSQAISSVRFSPDGASLLTAGLDGTVRLYRLPLHGGAHAGLDHNTPAKKAPGISMLARGASPEEWLTLTTSGSLQRWEGTSVQHERPISSPGFPLLLDAKKNLGIFSDGHEVTVLDLSTGDVRQRIQTSGHVQKITRTDFTKSLDRVLICGEPPAAGRDPLTAFLRAKSTALTRIINATAVEEVALVYDLKTGALLVPPLKHPDRLRGAEFSPDGKHFVTACVNGTARLYSTGDGQLIREWKHEFSLTRARFSPDGRTILTACGGWKQLPRPLTAWDAKSGAQRWIAWHEDDVADAVFSPDGARVATIGQNAQVRLFHAADGTPVGTPLTLSTPPGSVQFSPDGRLLAIAGSGREPNLLDAATARPLAIPMQHPGGISAVQFSADSRTLATTSNDSFVRLWPLEVATQSVGELQRKAELLSNQSLDGNAARRLTAREMQQRWEQKNR